MIIRHIGVKFDETAKVFRPTVRSEGGKCIQMVGRLPLKELMDWPTVVVDKDGTPIIGFEFRSEAKDFCEFNEGYKYYWLWPNKNKSNRDFSY